MISSRSVSPPPTAGRARSEPAVPAHQAKALNLQPEAAFEALKAGAYDYINKPFDLGDLEGLVERAVEVRRLRQEVAWRRAQADIGHQRSPAQTAAVATASHAGDAWDMPANVFINPRFFM